MKYLVEEFSKISKSKSRKESNTKMRQLYNPHLTLSLPTSALACVSPNSKDTIVDNPNVSFYEI
jgi:hypothetical protein